MTKVDRGGDATWCPTCGCLQDSNGVWYIPETLNYVEAQGYGVQPCAEHKTSPYWGKTERQIMEASE